MMRNLFVLILSFSFGINGFANSGNLTASDYISLWKDEAIYQMVVHKIPASITLAQGMLESGNGNSRLAIQGNNHFGIKCHSDWTGKSIYEDDETKGECFRKYTVPRDSFEDHSLFLKKTRYEKLFSYDSDDYKSWAKGLKECGYATNPKYPALLIKLIEDNSLHEYDEIGLAYIKRGELPSRPGGGAEPILPVAEKNKKEEKNYKKEERASITLRGGHEVSVSDNNIKYVIVKYGDSLQKIADDFEINLALLRRYNELQDGNTINVGQKIYLQPKRNKGKQAIYTVKKGDTMISISQDLGVKLKKLYRRNNMAVGQEPALGDTLHLR